MHSQQATVEIAQMREDLSTAQTLGDLDNLYFNWIGYSIVEDDKEATFDSVRALLAGYIDEFAAAAQ